MISGDGLMNVMVLAELINPTKSLMLSGRRCGLRCDGCAARNARSGWGHRGVYAKPIRNDTASRRECSGRGNLGQAATGRLIYHQ